MMAEADSWDADSFETEEPIKKAAVHDKWEGEDEDDDVKDNWDDDEEEEKVEENTEAKTTEKKKLSDKIKEKENVQRKKQEELRKQAEESNNSTERTPEEELAERLRVKKLQEDSDLELAKETFGVVSNNITGIDAMSPSSKEDFTEFERLLREKMNPYEKSIHYSSFLESLFRDLCLSLEVEDLKKINNSLTVLLGEKQRQEKQQNKGKKKKKGVVPGGGLKAKLKDDLADYGEFDGGYAQDYEDFM
ncbi:eukaryotic translation initiation factor 3 subunit J-A-like isoform X2 [Xyrauchen texanus]|uniref:eukaryotic translation initiation factor 3 subunit J-A-like isoform X2 n=1 Tax=Xyrauchen texanus TaxID=154827 RepID=UPI002242791D|nr:eukaryotic translation initiation factor 3 subunit J-A-like isoform X2 [Xyrauchen texanus]